LVYRIFVVSWEEVILYNGKLKGMLIGKAFALEKHVFI
jgi:hypothetical protein